MVSVMSYADLGIYDCVFEQIMLVAYAVPPVSSLTVLFAVSVRPICLVSMRLARVKIAVVLLPVLVGALPVIHMVVPTVFPLIVRDLPLCRPFARRQRTGRRQGLMPMLSTHRGNFGLGIIMTDLDMIVRFVGVLAAPEMMFI
jgi:hypothetical protein